MKKNKGFTLIELLIVVAIIGIIAAIAIPSLLRARLSANEAQMIGDARTVSSAEAAYNSAAGSLYGPATCLSTPSGAGCISNYAATAPTFLDPTIAGMLPKGGYLRTFTGGNVLTNALTTGGLDAYCYFGSALQQGQTGVRSFGSDASARICQEAQGGALCTAGVPAGSAMGATCIVLQ